MPRQAWASYYMQDIVICFHSAPSKATKRGTQLAASNIRHLFSEALPAFKR
jgi:hypothetical protein